MIPVRSASTQAVTGFPVQHGCCGRGSETALYGQDTGRRCQGNSRLRALRAEFPAASRVRVEFEFKPIGTALASMAAAPCCRTPSWAETATVALVGLSPNRYHWRSRVRFKKAAGRWTPFGANGESVADFVGPVDR